jgi:hypothetical protein
LLLVAGHRQLGYAAVKREPHGADRSITMLKQL